MEIIKYFILLLQYSDDCFFFNLIYANVYIVSSWFYVYNILQIVLELRKIYLKSKNNISQAHYFRLNIILVALSDL